MSRRAPPSTRVDLRRDTLRHVRVLIVDNFDSFTHNLAQMLGGLGGDVTVHRHDVPVAEMRACAPQRVVLSPGPGTPDRTGRCAELLESLPSATPVLGVCLGMQLMATLCGALVARAPSPLHGKASRLTHDGGGILTGLPQGVKVGRYHSLCVVPETLPPTLLPTAWAEDGVLMGLRHSERAWEGVQFHPESVLTPDGGEMLANFLRG